MKNIVELAEWGKESYDRSVIEPIEQMCGHRLCQRYEELYVDMDNRDGRDCGTLGEVFASPEEDFYFAWVEWNSEYKGFERLDQAKDWVEEMAAREPKEEKKCLTILNHGCQ